MRWAFIEKRKGEKGEIFGVRQLRRSSGTEISERDQAQSYRTQVTGLTRWGRTSGSVQRDNVRKFLTNWRYVNPADETIYSEV